jgi:alpha-glucosidase (family GH31 glycosyl hydrolase)
MTPSPRPAPHLSLIALATTVVSWVCSLPGTANPVIEGNARFTVITPTCIRIEQAPNGSHIDERSLFAVSREVRSDHFEIKRDNGMLSIDTGAIRLVYTPDGTPFAPSNLSAEIRIGKRTTTWTPGAPNPGNLGGTIRTLDNVAGPVDLGEGLLSRDGWYLLDDSKTPLLTDTWVRSRPEYSGTDWYLFGYGHDYKAALGSMIAIGGPAPMPRRYTMGIWFSRYWPFSSEDYREIINEYREHDFPLDIIVMDMDWHQDGWTGWSWNKQLIPEPKSLLRWFHDQELQVTLNLHPADGVGPHEDQYPAFTKALGEDPSNGQTLPFDAGNRSYIEALEKQVLQPLQDDGVDFWWLDWQQYPFTRSIPDLTNLFWLNRVLFHNTQRNGERGTSFSRWAGWGDHRHVIQFSGDAHTDWPMLAFQVPFTSTAGNVGCYYWSHDIGGHQGGRNEESYTRWSQFGALTAALRSHSGRDEQMDRRPWLYPKWAEDAMRVAFHLRAEIMPYVYSSAWQTHQTGISLNRPLYLEYPELEPAYHNGQQFLFGDHLLVAPVTTPGSGPQRVARQTVWFPPGDTWFNLFTGERFEGDQTRLVSADINEFPLYARGGVPIPMQPYSARPGTAALGTLHVRCYPGADGIRGEYSLHEDDGRSVDYLDGSSATTGLSYQRDGNLIAVEISAAEGTYRGQPQRRPYVIELPNTARGRSATANGKPANITYDKTLGITRVHVPPTDIRQPVRVEVIASEADSETFARVARVRRMRGITGSRTLGGPSPGQAPQATSPALLALSGVGLMPYHASPTFFGEKAQLAFVAPPGVVEGDRVKVVSETQVAGEYVETTETRGAGNEPILLDAGRYGRVEFRMNGQDHVLATGWIPMVGNHAPSARVSASSSERGHTPQSATDGVVGGYPPHPEQEWSTDRETVGASLELAWDKPRKISKIVLFDRPNRVDQVKAAKIRFSDGSTIQIGELENDGSEPHVVTFPRKEITSLTFEVTDVKPGTECSGLAEIGVY